MRKNEKPRRNRPAKVNSRPEISCRSRLRRRGTLRRTNNYNKLTMQCRPSCDHFSCRWISWGAWYHFRNGNLQLYMKIYRIPMQISPHLVVVGVWSHRRLSRLLKPPSCRPQPHLLLHIAKHIETHSPFAANESQCPSHMSNEIKWKAAPRSAR